MSKFKAHLKTLCVCMILIGSAGTWNPAVSWHGGLPPGATGPKLSEIRDLLRAGDWSGSIEAIEHYLPFLSGKDVSTALFLAGKSKILNNDSSGVDLLERITSQEDVVKKRKDYWLTRGHILTGDVNKAQTAYKNYKRSDGETIEHVRLLLDLAELVGKTRTYEEANSLTKSLKTHRLGWDEQVRLLTIRAKSNSDEEQRKELLRSIQISHPKVPVENNDLSRSERFRRANRLSMRWHYEEALGEYTALFKEGYRRSQSAWKMAVILQSKLRRDPTRVRKLLSSFVADKEHKHHEEALYRTIRAFVKQDLYKEALKSIEVYDEAFPNGKFRENTAYYKGWLPYDMGQCRRGLPALRNYVKRYAERRRHVRGFIAWCHMRNSRWKSAIRAYAPLVKESDSMHGGKALYWQAFAHRKLGDIEAAIARLDKLTEQYPLTYYEFLGRQLRAVLEDRPSQAETIPWPETKASVPEANEQAWTWPSLHGQLQDAFKRVRRLSELGELQLARRSYLPIRKRVEKSVPTIQRAPFISFMGRAIQDFNRGYKATGIKRGSGKGMSPQRNDPNWQAAFPLAYRPLVERLAAKSSIHPYFVYAIMRAESAYLASAVSHAEAVGALQMIRPTALKVANEIGVDYDPRTFQDPRVGFQYSVHYMRKHLDLWKGNFILAAASYNAGPKPVAEWLKNHQDKPLAFVVEEFVYNEARSYARRVAEYLLRYLALHPIESRLRAKLLSKLFPASFEFSIPKDVGY